MLALKPQWAATPHCHGEANPPATSHLLLRNGLSGIKLTIAPIVSLSALSCVS